MNNKIENKEKSLWTMQIPKLLIKMGLPMVIAMVVNGLYYLVDAAFVGWAVGAPALGGLAVVFPLQMLAVALATMIGVGTASIVSYKLGENNKNEAADAVKNAFMYAAILGVVIPVVLIVFKAAVLNFMGATVNNYVYANEYYSVIIPGFILIFLSFLETNTIRAEGNAKLAAFGMFLGSILNIGLDALFIFGFEMGTAGAAWGTVTARLITTILLTSYYLSKKSAVNVISSGWKLKGAIVKKISVMGIGPFLNQIGFSLLAVVMNVLLKKYGTDVDMSVYGVLARIFVFVTLPLMGIAQGFQPIVGYNYGAGDYGRIRKAIKTAYIYAFILGLVMFIFIMFMPKGVLGLFTDDAAVIENGASILQLSLMITPLIGWQLIAYFYFMSIGKPVHSLVISLFRQVIFIIPLLIVLPIIWGKAGIWIAYPIADILSIVIATLMVIKSSRQLEAVPSANRAVMTV